MTLEVENGTGMPNADAYCSVAYVDDYCTRMGKAWAGTEPQKAAFVRQATQYIDSVFAFSGVRAHAEQALAWPRSGATLHGHSIAGDAMPARLLDACAELAIRASVAPLLTDKGAQEVESVTVGPISRKLGKSTNNGQVRFLLVEKMLAPLFDSKFGLLRVELG
jgi:hypothetical protein